MSRRRIQQSTADDDICTDCDCGWRGCFRWIINDKYALSTQVLTLFAFLTIVSGGITLGICLGMLYALETDAYTSTQDIIVHNTKANAQNVGSEIAEAVQQRLMTISQSISMVNSLYGKVLLQYSDYNGQGTLYKSHNSYREYKFEQGCLFPDCPSDFGPISTRSRIPFLPGFENGSMEHSSVFLYSSKIGTALRNDSIWNDAFDHNPYLSNVLDGLAYQDVDFPILYNSGPNSTVMFYLSTQIYTDFTQSNYFSLHRTYPGILKNDLSYNPPYRPWFTNAPVNGIYVYGPYRETFTGKLVVTLSSKSTLTLLDTHPTSVVGGAVVLIEDLKQIVNQIKYANGGFGALLTVGKKVLVWGSRTDIYDYNTNQFKDLGDFDPALAALDLENGQVIEYTDVHDQTWYVSVETFFPSGTGNENAFMMLVFSKKSLAEQPLISLKQNINKTTASVSQSTIIIICVTIGGVMLLVSLMLSYIIEPLNTMRKISGELIQLSTEEEENRDYANVLQEAANNITRSDEVGLLASDYYHIIVMLQNKLLRKLETPKYPLNPFYLADKALSNNLTWKLFYDLMMQRKKSKQTEVDEDQEPQEIRQDNLIQDADSRMESIPSIPPAQRDKKQSVVHPFTPVPVFAADVGGDLSTVSPFDGDIELGTIARNKPGNQTGNQYTQISPDQIEIVPVAVMGQQVGCFSSLSSQLYFFIFLLLTGLTLAMILTIVSLANEGDSWTNESGGELVNVQMLNIQEIAQTKANFVQVSLFCCCFFSFCLIFVFFSHSYNNCRLICW
jgi:hypothetical protein